MKRNPLERTATVATSEAPRQEAATLDITRIRLDGGTQPRGGLDEPTVKRYTEDMARGEKFAPVDVMFDGSAYWLFDGFHRIAAAQRLGRKTFAVTIHQGTLAEAQWRSYAVNQRHGLPRSNADKTRAIRAALRHPNGASMSSRAIADYLGVDDKTVGKYREEMEATAEIRSETQRLGQDGRVIDTGNIGAKAEERPAPKRVEYVSDAEAVPGYSATTSLAQDALDWEQAHRDGWALMWEQGEAPVLENYKLNVGPIEVADEQGALTYIRSLRCEPAPEDDEPPYEPTPIEAAILGLAAELGAQRLTITVDAIFGLWSISTDDKGGMPEGWQTLQQAIEGRGV